MFNEVSALIEGLVFTVNAEALLRDRIVMRDDSFII